MTTLLLQNCDNMASREEQKEECNSLRISQYLSGTEDSEHRYACEKHNVPWLVWLSALSASLWTRRLGKVTNGRFSLPHWCFFSSLSPSLPLSLKKTHLKIKRSTTYPVLVEKILVVFSKHLGCTVPSVFSPSLLPVAT